MGVTRFTNGTLKAPADSTAAGQGYVDASTLGSIATQMRKSFPSFGGVMLWDASQAYGKLYNCLAFEVFKFKGRPGSEWPVRRRNQERTLSCWWNWLHVPSVFGTGICFWYKLPRWFASLVRWESSPSKPSSRSSLLLTFLSLFTGTSGRLNSLLLQPRQMTRTENGVPVSVRFVIVN